MFNECVQFGLKIRNRLRNILLSENPRGGRVDSHCTSLIIIHTCWRRHLHCLLVIFSACTVTIDTAGRVYRQRTHVHTANEKINLLIYSLATQSTSGLLAANFEQFVVLW